MTGELPPEIQQCKEVVEIPARTIERMNIELSSSNTIGPATALGAGLDLFFNQYTQDKKRFLDCLTNFPKLNRSPRRPPC